MYPDDRRYSRDHEWIKLEGERGRVGITDYAQNQLGDVVYLELPEVGRTLSSHDRFGTVESVKAVSELYCPAGGEVVEVNSGLVASPEAINSDPYAAGWMIVIKVADPAEVDALMDAAAYEAYLQAGK